MTVTHIAVNGDFENGTTTPVENAANQHPAVYKELVYAAALCNDASLDPDRKGEIIGDPTEGALIYLAQAFGIDHEKIHKDFTCRNRGCFAGAVAYALLKKPDVENSNVPPKETSDIARTSTREFVERRKKRIAEMRAAQKTLAVLENLYEKAKIAFKSKKKTGKASTVTGGKESR